MELAAAHQLVAGRGVLWRFSLDAIWLEHDGGEQTLG